MAQSSAWLVVDGALHGRSTFRVLHLPVGFLLARGCSWQRSTWLDDREKEGKREESDDFRLLWQDCSSLEVILR